MSTQRTESKLDRIIEQADEARNTYNDEEAVLTITMLAADYDRRLYRFYVDISHMIGDASLQYESALPSHEPVSHINSDQYDELVDLLRIYDSMTR